MTFNGSTPNVTGSHARLPRVGPVIGRFLDRFFLTERSAVLACLVAAAVVLTWLSLSLPPHAFVAGDSGVKLIAARNAIAHPSRPFEVDLPTIGGVSVPYVEHFFAVHGDHAHALQSPVFPALSAPFIAAMGLRGAYVLPLVSFIALLLALTRIRNIATPGVPLAPLLIVATLVNPVFFYALEFWEHVPAIALLAVATLCVLEPTASAWLRFCGGVCGALAMLLRPEAVWYVAALGWLVIRRDSAAVFVAGLASLLLPFALFNFAESGNVAGPHAAANLAPLRDNWLAARGQRARVWFAMTPAVIPALVVLACAWVGTGLGLEIRRAQLVALIAIAAMATAASLGAFEAETLWHAWPIGFLLFVPTTRRAGTLWFIALVSVTGVWLSSAHDGGSQWGPRFVLIATPVLVLLAGVAITEAQGPGYALRTRQLLVLVVLLAGLWTTRAAYRDLRGSKKTYATIIQSVESQTARGAYVLFSIWSFDQIVASLYESRTFLYAVDADTGTSILRRLFAAGISEAVLVWPRDSSDGASLQTAVNGTCYRISRVNVVPVVNWNLGFASCQPPRSLSE